MLVFMMLLFALLVTILLIQFRIYSHSCHKELSADTALKKKCAVTSQTVRATEMQE